MRKVYTWFPFCFVVLACIPSILGLVHPGFFASDDGNWMVIRFSAFYETLRSGQFPVRFLMQLNNEYGYPVADFLYPLFMYLGVPLKVVGFNFVTTVKLLFALSMIGSGVFSFLWLRKLFSQRASVLGALAYVYFPYHLYDLYQRGSIGEVLALAIIPLILWQIERKNKVLICISIALLILSHNILALLFLPIIIGYMVVRHMKLYDIFILIIESLGLSAFFWIPALYDKQFTVFDKIPVSDFNQYFISSSTIPLIGIVGGAGIVFGIISVFGRKHRFESIDMRLVTVYMSCVGVLALVLAFPVSTFFWHILPLKTFVQFPFRFLSVTILTTSFFIALGCDFLAKKRITWIVYSGIFVLITLSAIPYLLPKSYQIYPDGWYTTNMDTTTVRNEYMPTWVKQIPITYPIEKVVINGGGLTASTSGTISNLSSTAYKTQFNLSLTHKSIVTINTIYFPGWRVFVNGKEQIIEYHNPKGIIQVNLPAGIYSIKAVFTETPIRLTSDVLSLVSLIIVVGISLGPILKKR